MEYFKEIKQRLNKIADIATDKDVLVVPRDIAIGIIEDVERRYVEEIWKSKRNPPFNFYGEPSRLVIVKYKDSFKDPQICTYDYADQKFVVDNIDVTEKIKEWCDVPGYGYR